MNIRNKDGFTALVGAAFRDHTDVVEALLDASADPNLKGTLGLTALKVASNKGHAEIVQLLKEAVGG